MRTHESTLVRRQEIIDCARKIMATRGAHGLTTREIAHGVGLTEGALYRHFRSKRGVLLGLIDEIEETLFECIERAKEEGDPPLEQLANILREHLSYTERRRGVSFIVISEVLSNGDRQLRHRMRSVVERYLKTVEGILQEGIQSGQISPTIDPKAAAIALFGLVQGTVTLWHFTAREVPLAQRHEALWEVYRDGIVGGGPPSRRPPAPPSQGLFGGVVYVA